MDGKTIAIEGESDVQVLDLASRRTIASLPGHPQLKQAWPRAFSPDGSHLVTMYPQMYPTSRGWEVVVWDLPSGKQRLLIPTERWLEVAFSPDSRFLATLGYDKLANGSFGPHLKLWDLRDGSHRTLVTDTMELRGLQFTLDGDAIVAGRFGRAAKPGAVKWWDVATGEEHRSLANPTFPYALAFSKDGNTLVTADWDQLITIWDLASGERLRSFRHPQYADVKRLKLSPNERVLMLETESLMQFHPAIRYLPDWLRRFTAGKITVTLWDLNSGECLATLPTNHRFLTFADEGDTIVTYTYDGRLHWWDQHPGRSWGTILACSLLASLAVVVLFELGRYLIGFLVRIAGWRKRHGSGVP